MLFHSACRSASVVVGLVAVLGVLTGCGSNTSSEASSAPSRAAAGGCADAAALKSSSDTLRSVDVTSDRVDAHTTALANVKTHLAAASSSASSALQSRNIGFEVALATAGLRQRFAATGLTDLIGAEHFHGTVTAAVEACAAPGSGHTPAEGGRR